MHSYFRLLIVVLMIASSTTQASYKIYQAPLDESHWDFSGNPLQCSLIHQVPYYGQAVFSSTAGKSRPLSFSLSYKRQLISAVKVASIQSLSPAWLPRQRSRPLGEIPIKSGENIFQTQNTASWKLLNELEVGRFPTFRYQEFDTIQDQVAVSLSAVGFKKPYDQFLDCLTTLVPYELNQLNRMTLRFDFDKSSIKKIYQGKLKSLAAYLKYDPNVEVILINGYTDSKGPRGYNQKLAERRIAAVKKILRKFNPDESQFKTVAYGEKNPVASNRKAKGRALNRRVIIRVN